ncbi:MAG TPA: CpXC domain-containing protein, partial [Anaerolineaceae bacterium]|nr:CpXC domain-containing protein [Anaerolineaceae bacterium]
MPQIRTTCPRCKSPVLADVQQIVDVARDSQAKARLLNGSLNVMNCPHCGYQGMISTPLVYHDPDK